MQRFALSFDGSKLLYEAEGGRDGHTYGIIDAKPDGPRRSATVRSILVACEAR